MAFVNTLILLVLLAWSWVFTTTPLKIGEDVHLTIQSDIQKIIVDYLKEKNPNLKTINFDRLWTEAVDENQVKAHFIYSYTDENQNNETAKVTLEGFAVLNKDVDISNKEMEQWNFEELHLLNNVIEFTSPIQITSDEEPPVNESAKE